MAWAATNNLMNLGTLGGGTVIKNTVQLGVTQIDNVMQMTLFATPDCSVTVGRWMSGKELNVMQKQEWFKKVSQEQPM
ncbi:hypothetical protein F901_02998 [Acinetobacter dispersus]|uniref:hypothetical protein n=1 Tax=Acinetobacter dispersus TaxID=70348 RepID=UPI0002D0A199|nr:hypothetical protein [Acinetobacter dispersus]ENX51810.1 hypothetical protein F901_02998 [Acinetobacter dispersus]